MTSTVVSFSASRFTRRHVVTAAVMMAVVAALLYFQWRTIRASAAANTAQQDTMCMASRFGFSCR